MIHNGNIYRGYWPQILNGHGTDFMMDEYEGTEMSAYSFLHGNCAFFAYALAKRMGYEIIMAYTLDPEYICCFAHAYCHIEKDGKLYYFDIRGVTTNEDILLEEFDIYLKNGGDDFVSFEPITCEELKNSPYIDGYDKEKILGNANQFIEVNLDFYQI